MSHGSPNQDGPLCMSRPVVTPLATSDRSMASTSVVSKTGPSSVAIFARCTCMSPRPGMRNFPRPSTRTAPSGIVTSSSAERHDLVAVHDDRLPGSTRLAVHRITDTPRSRDRSPSGRMPAGYGDAQTRASGAPTIFSLHDPILSYHGFNRRLIRDSRAGACGRAIVHVTAVPVKIALVRGLKRNGLSLAAKVCPMAYRKSSRWANDASPGPTASSRGSGHLVEGCTMRSHADAREGGWPRLATRRRRPVTNGEREIG